ncbi:tRNA threonylcarbamoyladenosine biosynthesis protein RimN [Acinetobacter sp. 187]|uniref:Threonylcarbamoyl-AMP synthase n=1 Tax=Acinetobacter lanii TaxID=2715163 RepID=A0A6G8S7G1_9GAMM|nr:Sua5/YciO/YrdC/YwlC family protein [Acinetobacter lanii]NHC04904.1 tRNA threonylcarbamoyladenosine biosynthesis protein RimN [Acinetobacter lanii]QIO10125.1 tRNA threonylcarbamoyladenosine biosynthesis protein RimN [Acinetobacter lanii]
MITTSVAEAAQCLAQGQVLAYPTEAVWGLGCDPFNESAFLEILRLKQRPIEKGVILLAGQVSQVEHLLKNLDPEIREQVIATWSNQGVSERATTWLLPADESIPHWIKGNHPKVAVRVTNHPLCIALCNAFNGFIVSTSANPAGLPSARSIQEVSQYFGSELNYLNGDLGLSQDASKIIDAVSGEVIRA